MFPAVEGQEVAKGLLHQAVATRQCPPGYLFFGPGGVGKRTMALEMGRLLNCEGGGNLDCSCDSCRKCRLGAHPDVLVYSPENRVFRVDMVRALREEAIYRPYLGKWKVLVLDEAERMSTEASNAFLKVLEEPPGPTVFVILCEGDDVLPTIRSRCISVPFFPLRAEQVQRILSKSYPVDSDLKAQISGGIVSKAMAYEDSSLWGTRGEALMDFLTLWSGKLENSRSLMKSLGDTIQEAQDKLEHFQSFLRDIWLLRAGQGALVRNRDFVSEISPLAGHSTEVLALVTHRTNEFLRLLGNSNLEVQKRAYLCTILVSVAMSGSPS